LSSLEDKEDGGCHKPMPATSSHVCDTAQEYQQPPHLGAIRSVLWFAVETDRTHSQCCQPNVFVSKVRFPFTPGSTGPVSPSISSASRIWTCLPFLLTILVSPVPPAATFLPPPSCLLYHQSCLHTSPLTLGPTFPRPAVCIYTPPSLTLQLRANRRPWCFLRCCTQLRSSQTAELTLISFPLSATHVLYIAEMRTPLSPRSDNQLRLPLFLSTSLLLRGNSTSDPFVSGDSCS
jgi:hypothetical protein